MNILSSINSVNSHGRIFVVMHDGPATREDALSAAFELALGAWPRTGVHIDVSMQTSRDLGETIALATKTRLFRRVILRALVPEMTPMSRSTLTVERCDGARLPSPKPGVRCEADRYKAPRDVDAAYGPMSLVLEEVSIPRPDGWASLAQYAAGGLRVVLIAEPSFGWQSCRELFQNVLRLRRDIYTHQRSVRVLWDRDEKVSGVSRYERIEGRGLVPVEA